MSKENTKKKETKEQPKVQKKEDLNKKVKTLKTDLKKANEQITILTKKITELEMENQKNISDFQEKAKGFAKKAQEEVSRLKAEINEKQAEDLKHHKKYGSQKMLESILDPIINIELAVAAGKNNDAVSAYVIGFEMLLTQLENELATFGVFKIQPKIGDEFDPELMYAVSKDSEGTKIKTVKKPGFRLHERTIKPAVVTIG